MELDLVYLGSMCTQLYSLPEIQHIPHHLGLYTRARCWSAKMDDISFLAVTYYLTVVHMGNYSFTLTLTVTVAIASIC
jgi:hypothetical protein